MIFASPKSGLDNAVPSRWNLRSIRSVMLFFLVWRRERGSPAPLDRDLGKREPLILKIPALWARDGSNVLVTLLVERQRATVLQLSVVHQISERTTKAEE